MVLSFRRTNAVLKEATEEHFVLYSVLWFRGIIPKALLPQRDRATIANAMIWMTEGFDEVMRKSQIAYSDGTGGQADVPAAIRPAGWGAATFAFKVRNGVPEVTDIQCIGGDSLANKLFPGQRRGQQQCYPCGSTTIQLPELGWMLLTWSTESLRGHD